VTLNLVAGHGTCFLLLSHKERVGGLILPRVFVVSSASVVCAVSQYSCRNSNVDVASALQFKGFFPQRKPSFVTLHTMLPLVLIARMTLSIMKMTPIRNVTRTT